MIKNFNQSDMLIVYQKMYYLERQIQMTVKLNIFQSVHGRASKTCERKFDKTVYKCCNVLTTLQLGDGSET